MNKLENVNIRSEQVLVTPAQLKRELPVTPAIRAKVQRAREAVKNILQRDDPRLVVVVGPCSIHDPEAALDYARRLAKLAGEVDDSLLLVMRAYFESGDRSHALQTFNRCQQALREELGVDPEKWV